MEIDIEKCCMTCYPAKVLSEVAAPVEKINDNIKNFAEKMIDIMIENKGIGLAGPQAGVSVRVFVISLDGSREKAKVYVNPVITLSGELEADYEGCLSLPGLDAKIKRYKICSVTAIDLEGKEFTDEADGLYARAIQHEYDHLEGTLIKDRLSQVGRISARKILKNLEEKARGQK